MTQSGELFGESPQACPFIALELDRDRRSDKPDYRHRCFAEPTPQPRAIAHQERYCLSPEFAACPIFQGWAMRAAARPVPLPQGLESRAKGAPPSVDQPPRVPTQPALPPDVPLVVPLPGEAWPGDAFSTPVAPDAPRPRASRPEMPYKETVTREDVVPSWDLTDRFGAEAVDRRGRDGSGGDDRGGDRFGGMITAVVVIAILALGVLGVIFVPGLLAGKGPAASATPTFSTALPSGLVSPSLPAGPTGSPLVTAVPTAQVTPTPAVTPRLYRVKASDNSLTQIAHRFGLTLRQLLDANPQITNPDIIQVGQVITIPQPPSDTPQPSA